MTPPKARKAAQAPTQAPEPTQDDPLADLRDDPTPGDLLENPDADPENPESVEVRPLVTQGIQDEMVTEVMTVWHADTVSLGFLHKGGACGCRYLAKVALRQVVPVLTEADLEPRDLDAPED